MVQVFNKEGKEIFLVEINSLCPIVYHEEAKKIAYDYFVNIEKINNVNIDQMFNKFLKPISATNATHIWCPQKGYNDQLQRQIDSMISYNLNWVGNRVYTIEDDPNELLSKFVCVSSDPIKILTVLQLEVV